MNFNTDELEKIIEQLGVFLNRGWQELGFFYISFWDVKDNPNFDPDEYFTQQAASTISLTNEIHNYLSETFGQNHHYNFKFTQPRIPTSPMSSVPIEAGARAYGHAITMDAKLHELSEIAFRLEERLDLSIRREIARHERDASTLYEITYPGREIRINDVYLSKQDFGSENEVFFSYIFERPWQKIKMEDMLADLGLHKFKKSVSQMLNDMKLTGNIRKIFCPDASSKAIVFRNPINRGFADENKLPILGFGRNDKK